MQMSSDAQEQQSADSQSHSFWFPNEKEIVVFYSTQLCPRDRQENKYIIERILFYAVSLTLTCVDVY